MRIFASILTLTALLMAPVVLSAHMKYEKSVPAADSTVDKAPTTIQVWFSQAPDTAVSKIEVAGPNGPVKTMGLHAMEKSVMVTLDGATPDGAYTVSWQSAGDDGHVQKGEFKFTVKAAAQ